jgi:hypothetical protein
MRRSCARTGCRQGWQVAPRDPVQLLLRHLPQLAPGALVQCPARTQAQGQGAKQHACAAGEVPAKCAQQSVGTVCHAPRVDGRAAHLVEQVGCVVWAYVAPALAPQLGLCRVLQEA